LLLKYKYTFIITQVGPISQAQNATFLKKVEYNVKFTFVH